MACQYHDYGKANKAFQSRINNKKRFNDKIEIPHNILSMYFVKREDFEYDEDYYIVAEVVLNHHDYGEVGKIIEEQNDLINELLDEFNSEIVEIQGRKLKRIMAKVTDDKALLVKGYLHRCDYSASSGTIVEYPNNFLEQKLEEMMTKWQMEGKKVDAQKMIEWNEMQQFCIENSDKNLIITAQTGMGKTEAGLLWMGNNKGFFILPIRTAINAIYDRVTDVVLNKENIIERVALLHSENLSYYAKKKEDIEIPALEYHIRSRQLSIPITISTLDQIFDFIFKYSGFEMKLTTLSYSKIIIDEIQMYGADLLAYLIYGIYLITKYGGRVAILTATLPPFIRDLLVDKGFVEKPVEVSFTNDMLRHSLRVYEESINVNYIIAKYNENKNLRKTNKILVVCNTVKNAQQVYQNLQDHVFKDELHILHNKLIKKDRTKREKEIKSFGKTYDDAGNIDIQNGIWVTTSIVEASLDIDFDYLFTELSDLNGLFQRLGRCNRKGVKALDTYNCFVFTEINKNLFVNGNKGFIDKEIYDYSKMALENIDGVITEEQKMQLINEYFTMEKLRKSDYMQKFNDTWEYINSLNINEVNKNEIKLRNIISYTIIPFVIYQENYNDIMDMVDKYQDLDSTLEEKIYYKDEIMKYTMSVEAYVYKKSKVETTISLGKMNMIYVLDCYYSEIGFQLKINDGTNIW